MPQKLGLLEKLPKEEERKVVFTAFQNLSHGYANVFLPTLVFDKKDTKEFILKAKKGLDKVV